MTVEVGVRNGICVVGLRGEVSLGEPTKLLRETSYKLLADGQRHFVLDLLQVPWLDSSGLGEIVASYKRARERQGVVKLVLRDRTYSMFTLTQLDRVFEIYDDVGAAVASFGPESS